MANADAADVRDRRGDWKPPSTIKSPPLFTLPFNPLKTLKWIFGWPGYLLPWNELSFFATKVGTDMAGAVPLIGPYLLTFLRGGEDAVHSP